jgi:Putative ATPase subunit of terminase (gpP-like)
MQPECSAAGCAATCTGPPSFSEKCIVAKKRLTQQERILWANDALATGMVEALRILAGGDPAPGGTATSKPDGYLLVSMARIAERLDTGRSTVYNWSVRYAEDWPAPVAGEGKSAVYWWPEVQVFIARHGLLRHRFRRHAEPDMTKAVHERAE